MFVRWVEVRGSRTARSASPHSQGGKMSTREEEIKRTRRRRERGRARDNYLGREEGRKRVGE
eukprot:1104215-Rhodomonas_salina.6